MDESSKTEVVGGISPMHASKLIMTKKPSLKRSTSSVLKLSSDAIEAYCQYEALDYAENSRELWQYFLSKKPEEEKSDDDSGPVVYPRFKYGIFSIPFAEPDLQPGIALDAYKLFMRCASMSWRYCIRWMLVYISRRVSGITKAEDVTLVPSDTSDVFHKCTGYYGWGKVSLILDPIDVCERVRTEFTNWSVVSALFLTITVPLITDPPDAVMQYTNESSVDWLNDQIIQTAYVIACGGAVACQVATTGTAISMITNLNKCQSTSGETGVMFIKSIFNPYNGITGAIGPLMYCGTIASCVWTIWITVFTCMATFNNPVDIWALHFILMLFVFCLYLLQLALGIMAEFHVMTPELNNFAKEPQTFIKNMEEEKQNRKK
eukprot:gene35728-46351_t